MGQAWPNTSSHKGRVVLAAWAEGVTCQPPYLKTAQVSVSSTFTFWGK